MRFTTEFNIGQEVYFMKENRIASGKVIAISCNVRLVDEDLETKIRYKIVCDHLHLEFLELNLFPDKHALLHSLLNN